MSIIEVYTRKDCVFCTKVKSWFEQRGILFFDRDVTSSEDFGRFKERFPGVTTIPQIVIDGHFIGGYETLMEYEGPILARLREKGSGEASFPGQGCGDECPHKAVRP